MRVFVTDLHTTLGATIARHLQDADHEVLGSVPSKAQLAPAKRKLLSHPSSDREDAVKDPVTAATDKLSTTKLLQKADVVIATGLAQDTKAAMELLKQFEKAAASTGEDDEEEANGGGVKRFVAISSILTWSKNAAFANPQKDQRGHREDDFKTRKPARKYAELKTAETQILSANKVDVLETCVVAAGLLYGGAQSSLMPLFRNAWMYPERALLVPALPGSSSSSTTRGENLLPLVSVYDLALLASRLAVVPAVPKPYIVAVDTPSQSTTLRDVCLGLSVLLGNGTIRDLLTEDDVEALLVSEDDADADGGSGILAALQLHLCFDSGSETSVMTSLVPVDEYKHVATGLLSNLAFYVEDFVASMDLRPLQTVVLGPPRVGKTTLSERLAKEYCVPHLTVESIANEVLLTIQTGDAAQENADATQAEAKPEDESSGGNNSVGAGDEPELQQLRVELEAWQATSDETKTATVDELPEATVVALLRWKLASAVCRNQGFVLDGMPTSVDHAAKIFERIGHSDKPEGDEEGGDAHADAKAESPPDSAGGADGGDDDDDAEAKAGGSLSKSRSKAILDRLRPTKQVQFPNRVIILQAPLELLEQRAQMLSDELAVATGNSQSRFATRHALFAAEAEGLATFFEQKSPNGTHDGVEVLEIHLESAASFADSDVLLTPVKNYMEQGGGKPHNFHPTRDELKQMERDFARKKQDDEARLRQLELDQEDRNLAAQHARMEAERARLEIIQREEAELLETRAKPLRTYLMDTVLPALTEGMLEIIKVQPDDPIDYLAEFLFKKGRDLETDAS